MTFVISLIDSFREDGQECPMHARRLSRRIHVHFVSLRPDDDDSALLINFDDDCFTEARSFLSHFFLLSSPINPLNQLRNSKSNKKITF